MKRLEARLRALEAALPEEPTGRVVVVSDVPESEVVGSVLVRIVDASVLDGPPPTDPELVERLKRDRQQWDAAHGESTRGGREWTH